MMLGQAWTTEQMRGLAQMVSGYPAFNLSHIPTADVTQQNGLHATGEHPEMQGTGARNQLAAPSLVANPLFYGDGSVASDKAAEVEAFQAYVRVRNVAPQNKDDLRAFHAKIT